MEASDPKTATQVADRRDDVLERIAAALGEEARRTSVKEFARDAEVSEQRAKQIRVEAGNIHGTTLILLAQRRPELRSLLTELMHAEVGDAERTPAQILDAIVRLVR